MLAFAGAFGGQLLARRTGKELELRSKREEAHRVLRWAAELAVSEHPGRQQLGVSQLDALLVSDLLDEDELAFADAAISAVTGPAVDEIDEIEQTGEEVDVEVANLNRLMRPIAEGGIVDEESELAFGYDDEGAGVGQHDEEDIR